MSVDQFAYLLSLEQFGIKFGLDSIRAILGTLDHPERAFKSVHVAGTNGKGSVTAMVDSALRAAGHRSARYTSPHLIDLTERFVIDGQAVTRESLASAIDSVRDAVSGLQTRGALTVHPTFFEVTTAVAFELFRRADVDVAVCEVGLGGRLDATNVLSPDVSAITSISFDHEQYLGNTLAAIAAEKAGVIKTGVPVVVGDVDPVAWATIAEIARERNAPMIRATDGVTVGVSRVDPRGTQTLTLTTPLQDYGSFDLALAGSHQIANAIVAIRTLEQLDVRGVRVSSDAITHGLETVQWPGRLQTVTLSDGREALLDAAHNPAGAAALEKFLATLGERRPLVFGAMRDKDASGMLKMLTPHASAVALTRASSARATEPDALSALVHTIAPALPVTVHASPAEALAAAWRLNRRIVVAGLIFLIGEVMEALGRP